MNACCRGFYLIVVWCGCLGLISCRPAGRQGEAAAPLALIRDNVALARIVVAEKPEPLGINKDTGWQLDRSRDARYAAEFLQRYLQRVTGVQVPIITDREAPNNAPLILVGRSALTEFVEPERRKLPPEGFILRRAGNRIAIVGEVAPESDLAEYRGADRGTLFGVFEFLERVAGVRWYFPHELGVVIPATNRLEVAALDVTKSPAFPMRTGAISYRKENGEEYGQPLPVVRYGNTTGFHVNHTCYHWYRYVTNYPEVFAVGPDGKQLLCATNPGGNSANHLCYSEPKTMQIDLQEYKDFYARGVWWGPHSMEPSEKYVRFGPKDIENIYHCCCPRCRARWSTDKDNSQLSEVIFGYADRLARAVDEQYPGRRVATFSYCGYQWPPDAAVASNVDVMVCTVKGGPKLVSPGHWRYNTELIDAWWNKLGRDPARLFIFEYLVYPSATDVAPLLYPHTLQRWFRFLRGKASGGVCNGTGSRDGIVRTRFSLINGWFWHKLLWNPDEDVDALLNGFYRDLFGPAAQPMGELFNLVIARWEQAPLGDGVNPGGVSHVPDRQLYRDVYPPEVIQNIERLLGQARAAAPADSVWTKRVAFFGEAFDVFIAKAKAFRTSKTQTPVYRVNQAEQPPVIDGKPDEETWQKASAILLRERRLGEPPPLTSEVRVLCRDQTLFISGRFETATNAASLVARGTNHDDRAVLSDERFELDLDLRLGRTLELKTIYRIVVNSNGITADGLQLVPLVVNSAHHSLWDPFWDPAGLQAAACKADGSWSFEMLLPLTSITEYAEHPSPSIRTQMTRVSLTKPGGMFSWSPDPGESYEIDPDRFGTLLLGADEARP